MHLFHTQFVNSQVELNYKTDIFIRNFCLASVLECSENHFQLFKTSLKIHSLEQLEYLKYLKDMYSFKRFNRKFY